MQDWTYRAKFGEGRAMRMTVAPELLVEEVDVQEEVGDRVLVHHRYVAPCEEVLENAHVKRNQLVSEMLTRRP